MPTAVMGPIIITDSKIYRKPTGMVAVWMEKMSIRFGNEARKYAPMRSGQLKAGIHSSTHQVGPKQIELVVESTAPHTMYVLRGTGFPVRGRAGRIYSTRGFARVIRGQPLTKRFFDIRSKADRKTKRGSLLPGTTLAVGKQHLYPPVTVVPSVSGQEPNDFMERAWRATARYHRSIRGIPFPVQW